MLVYEDAEKKTGVGMDGFEVCTSPTGVAT